MRGGPFPALRLLRAHRRMSGAELRTFQSRRLRVLVRHAAAHVPFWRRRLQAARVDPASIRGLEDLSRLPIVERAEMQSEPAAQLCDERLDVARLRVWKTSGSTGEPFVTRRTTREVRMLGALRLDALRRLGLRRGDRLAFLSYLPDADRRAPWRLRLSGFLGGHAHRKVHCEGQPDEVAARLAEARPDVIVGLASSLSRLERTASSPRLRNLGVRFVAPGGQFLAEGMRRAIQNTFDAPVHDTYGAYEFGLMGWECPDAGGLHTVDAGLIQEVVTDGREADVGERGEVVGTALHSFAMPLIRYRVGDLAVRGPAPCACGRAGTTIRRLEGRMSDFLMRPDGTQVHPATLGLHGLADAFDWIQRYQVVQPTIDRVHVLVVPRIPPPPGGVAALATRLERLLGTPVQVTVECVDDLAPGGRGKFRTVRCLVDSLYEPGTPPGPGPTV